MSLQIMHLAGLRRRRAIAISSKQYVAYREQKSLSAQNSKGRGVPSLSTDSSASKSTTRPGMCSNTAAAAFKEERRAQIKLDIDRDAVEALDILEEQQEALSLSVSSLSSLPSPGMDELQQAKTLPRLVLGDVAVTKALRRSVDSDYEHISPPQWKVVVLDGEEEGEKHTDVEAEVDWVVLEDEPAPSESSSASSSPLTKTFAEVAAIAATKVH